MQNIKKYKILIVSFFVYTIISYILFPLSIMCYVLDFFGNGVSQIREFFGYLFLPIYYSNLFLDEIVFQRSTYSDTFLGGYLPNAVNTIISYLFFQVTIIIGEFNL